MTTVKTKLFTIDSDKLQSLAAKGKSDPTQVRTLKCRTVTKKRFIHENQIRTLAPHIIDEPPGLLGDDTAPNPSEAALAALGSCIAVGIQANAVHQNITLYGIEIELEADINITSVWGVGDTSPKQVGFSEVRVTANIDADADQAVLSKLLEQVMQWSPVNGTFTAAIPVKAKLAS